RRALIAFLRRRGVIRRGRHRLTVRRGPATCLTLEHRPLRSVQAHSNLDPLTTTRFCMQATRFEGTRDDQQRLLFTNPFTSGMKMVAGTGLTLRLWVMSYVPGVLVATPGLKRAAQSHPRVWSVALEPADFGGSRSVLFPNPSQLHRCSAGFW